MMYASPALISTSVPSSCRTAIRPEWTTPTWRAWQLSVPTTGLMHSDQRHPARTRTARPWSRPCARHPRASCPESASRQANRNHGTGHRPSWPPRVAGRRHRRVLEGALQVERSCSAAGPRSRLCWCTSAVRVARHPDYLAQISNCQRFRTVLSCRQARARCTHWVPRPIWVPNRTRRRSQIARYSVAYVLRQKPNSSEQSMSTGPMAMPSTPSQVGAAVVWVRAMPVSVVHAPVRR